jgi:hypothetical protein
MLRITAHETDPTTVLLRLEGKLLEPWIGELERCVDGAVAARKSLSLDLSTLTFADAAGTRVLAELIERGIPLAACSGFVAALLHREKQ